MKTSSQVVMREGINSILSPISDAVNGRFVDLSGERYYLIENVDKMTPFFMSLVSSNDHWMFISSRGGLTAGRVSPETALFPYVTVDKVHESTAHTGSKTLLRASRYGQVKEWEPFNREHDARFSVTRNLYKSLPGNKLCFEEINHDLKLAFRYTWMTSDDYGFVRHAQLVNLGDSDVTLELIDGLQNILPAGAPRSLQNTSSNLIDAYKWNELDEACGLAMFTLYSGITDRAEPHESLRANTAFYVGDLGAKKLLEASQLNHFRANRPTHQVAYTRGIRGAYFVELQTTLTVGQQADWYLVADVERSQSDVVGLLQQLDDPKVLLDQVIDSVQRSSNRLQRILASADAMQTTAQETVLSHHLSNVLFNVMRGGIFHQQYTISKDDLSSTLEHFNQRVYQNHRDWLSTLPETLDFTQLMVLVRQRNDQRLEALCQEYLPITFGRRHGDPSRPWNQFSIRLRDESGRALLFYEGNWRDIFQNWEALAISYPEFIENIIAKFVNASTIDGYNPYRITKHGIDWEVEDPDDPWSYIGYWGDHQIIYLLKLLEVSRRFHPQRLSELLRHRIFSYANVPYRIRPLRSLLKDPKNTVDFDADLAQRIDQRVAEFGADGKLLLDDNNDVVQVNLLEKLLIPLLAKLGNLVVDGGIWLNTQRPEWNDANNALVGQGLSMVTLYYMRRYVKFIAALLVDEQDDFEISVEVSNWVGNTAIVFSALVKQLTDKPVNDELRHLILWELGQAADQYRAAVYAREGYTGRSRCSAQTLRSLLAQALNVIDHSIHSNRRDDHLYHAYNLMQLKQDRLSVGRLQAMLEGQVAVLSSGALSAEQACHVLEALFSSDLYRADQKTFMLYPDRPQLRFLQKNVVDAQSAKAIPSLMNLLESSDQQLVVRDGSGVIRFNPELVNRAALENKLTDLENSHDKTLADSIERDRHAIIELYRRVFKHDQFTGRSEGMFGFEGLGCIYWHMVSKLLLATQECFFAADVNTESASKTQLGHLYYRVREGIGFNKQPAEYGAFPLDPYSHTPKHAGARQPGMTGQVKEEILTRWGELGLQVESGIVSFKPDLLRAQEFLSAPGELRYLTVENHWETIELARGELAFTWCQVPVLYQLHDKNGDGSISVEYQDHRIERRDSLSLSGEDGRSVMQRDGSIRQITVRVPSDMLFGG